MENTVHYYKSALQTNALLLELARFELNIVSTDDNIMHDMKLFSVGSYDYIACRDKENNILGYMKFYETEYNAEECIWIEKAFVRPEYRKKGVYSKMYKRLRSEHTLPIMSGVLPTNKNMIAIKEKQGAKVLSIIYKIA